MKEYRFTTDSGVEVILETEHNEDYYFGLYITCEFAGWNRYWLSPSMLTERSDYTLASYSRKLHKMCRIVVPQKIYTEITADYLKATRNCGKYIMAKITDENNKVISTRVGRAVAVVYFRGDVKYRMPISMEDAIRAHACDNKIFYYPVLEEGIEECKCPTVYEEDRNHYYIRCFIPNDPFFAEDDGTDEEGEHVLHELSLELIDIYQEL